MRPQWFSTSLADEEAGFRRADIVLAIQAREAAEFEARIKGSNTCVIQVGHLIDMYPLAVPSTREAAIFLGSNNPINTVGARYFIEQVLPLVRQAKPNFELLLVGSVSNEIEEQPGVVPLGFVDSLSEAFGAAMVAINPVRTGTGINIKLLDAMAAGMPIVSTQSGARGMEHMEGSAFIVVNDDDATNFAQQVIALLDDSQMRQRLSAGARAAAENWNTAQLGTLFAALARRPVETIASARKHSSDQMNTAPTHIRGI